MSQKRLETFSPIALRHFRNGHITRIVVIRHDGLKSPAEFLLPKLKQIVSIDKAPIVGLAFLGDCFYKLFFRKRDPRGEEHFFTQTAIFLQALRLCVARSTEMAEDGGHCLLSNHASNIAKTPLGVKGAEVRLTAQAGLKEFLSLRIYVKQTKSSTKVYCRPPRSPRACKRITN